MNVCWDGCFNWICWRLELFDGKGGIVEAIIARVGRTTIDVETTRDTRYLSPVGPFWHVAAAFGELYVLETLLILSFSFLPLLYSQIPLFIVSRSSMLMIYSLFCGCWLDGYSLKLIKLKEAKSSSHRVSGLLPNIRFSLSCTHIWVRQKEIHYAS